MGRHLLGAEGERCHPLKSARLTMQGAPFSKVRSLLPGFDVEALAEIGEEDSAAFQGRQLWHGLDIIARWRTGGFHEPRSAPG